MKSEKSEFLFNITGLLAITTFGSRILGFVREMIFASFFGTSYFASAYKAAYNIPDFIRTLFLSGVISAVFIPIFTEYKTKYDDEKAQEFVVNTINIVTVVGSLLTGLCILLSPFIVKFAYYGLYGKTYTLAVLLTEVLFPILIILSLNGIVMGSLHSYSHFTVPAITPIINNVIIITATLLLCPRFKDTSKIVIFASCVVISDLIHLIINASTLKKFKFKWKSIFQLKHPALIRMLYFTPVAIFCNAPFFINSLIDKIICSPIEMQKEGAISALSYAFQVQQLPYSVFAISVVTAFYPTLSYHVAEGRINEFKITLTEGIRIIFFCILPCSTTLIFLANPIIKIIFERGAFTSKSTALTVGPLIGYSIGLFAGSTVQLILRAYFSLKDYITPAKVGAVMIVLNIICDLIFIMPFFKLFHTGIAVSTSVVAPVNMITLLFLLRKKIGAFDSKKTIICFLKVLFSALTQGVVSIFVFNFLKCNLSFFTYEKLNLIINFMLAFIAGGFTYLIMTYLLGTEEVKTTLNLLKKIVLKKIK